MERVSPGMKVGGRADPLRRSSTVNSILEATDHYLRHVAGGQQGGSPSLGFVPWVKVRNSSGADRAAGEALEVGSLLTTNIEPGNFMFDADLRGASLGMCGVLLDHVTDGKTGRLQLWGLVKAQVDVNDEHHTHVYFKTADANPQSNFGGPARIVYKPSGTGLKTCVLCLGDAQYRRKGRTVDTIAADGTGTVNVRLNNTSDPGSVEAAYNHMTAGLASIPSDVDVLLWWYDDEEQWVIEAAECTA